MSAVLLLRIVVHELLEEDMHKYSKHTFDCLLIFQDRFSPDRFTMLPFLTSAEPSVLTHAESTSNT